MNLLKRPEIDRKGSAGFNMCMILSNHQSITINTNVCWDVSDVNKGKLLSQEFPYTNYSKPLQ